MKTTTVSHFGFTCMILLFVFFVPEVISFTNGPTAGSTGSKGDNKTTCVQCHASQNNVAEDLISCNGLANGYQYAVPYTIKLKIKKAGCVKFGFQTTCEDLNGEKQGTPASTNANVQVVGTFYSSHTAAGTAQADSAEWTYQWTSPNSNRGKLTFYGAFIAANSNSQHSGDIVYISEYYVVANETIGMAEKTNNGKTYFLFPNPASDEIHISFLKQCNDIRLQIMNLSGAVVKEVVWGNTDALTVDVSDVAPGTYILSVNTYDDSFARKLIIFR
ncbi:MAG: T9SS type A sorting domain-containing protein [Bacteroidales bacterium]|nr:T9SS type A sorting domain-containing protein [Bacteroidales bacterium]